MTLSGHIENGNIVLDVPVAFANGTKVRVELTPATDENGPADSQSDESGPTLYEMLKPIIGAIKDAPPDFAHNHDHYIHGVPKK
jgi:hypothetical protein